MLNNNCFWTAGRCFLIRADGFIDGCNLACKKCKKGDLQAFPGGLKADTANQGSIAARFVLIHISEEMSWHIIGVYPFKHRVRLKAPG
jgi:hypothetical protein